MRCLFWLALLLPFYATAVDYWQDQPLPAKWQQYLALSDQLLQQDASAFAAELVNSKAQPALKHKEFGLTAISTAAEAEAVLSFQTPSGGWSKRTDMRLPRKPGQHYGSEPDYVPTFDNNATSTQLQWLADYYPQAPKPLRQQIAAAIERGVALVIDAQYPNGGFAQSYPLRGDYHDAVTLNDNALYQLMQLLWQAAHDTRFAMLPDNRRQAAEAAFYRTVDWLLANQVWVKGQLTVWGAQHHPLTGEPVAARKFEQASLVSTESAKLLLLMLQTAADYPGVAASLAAGAHWLRQHQISGKIRHRDEHGYLSLKDSPGSVIWSRFYDLQSGEPVFFDRDGKTYATVSQLSLERQRGYGWYQSVAAEFLVAYDSWLGSGEHCRNFGLGTAGGHGGAVLKVTNLNRSGPGSLAAALAATGPRTVVFEVAGVIDLERSNLSIEQPFITIAGETAPAPGITLIKGGLRIVSHDVIVRHLHIRPGDAGLDKRTGWDTDGIAVTGKDACNVLVEYNSVSWATDELVSASGPRDQGPAATAKHVTFRRNILAEALDYATHIKGKHSKGALVHDNVQQVAFIENLFVSNDRRNPYFKAFSSGVVANNLIVNAGNAAVQLGFVEREWLSSGITPQNPRVAVVGNVLRYGLDSYSDLALVSDRGDAYISDNLTFNLRQQPMYDTQGVLNLLPLPPLWPEGFAATAANATEMLVLSQAGARYWQRDSIDQRILQQVQDGSSRIIDSQQQVGGYPQITPVQRALDIPDSNTDSWLRRFIPELSQSTEP